jgi:hypothetical protein
MQHFLRNNCCLLTHTSDFCTWTVFKNSSGASVSDPHWFLMDPEPGKNLNADPDPDSRKMNLLKI